MKQMLIIAALLAAGALILVWHTRRALRREREENHRLRAILQVSNQMVQRDLEHLRRLHHDLRHYLLLSGDTDLSQDTAAVLRRTLEGGTHIPGGEGWAISALEQHYRERAKSLGFQADLQITPPHGWEYELPDLCLVLSNLLENSIEALQREKGGTMRARSHSTAGYFSLVIGNTCTRPLRTFNGHYLSSKAPGRLGIGLETVQEIVQRYGGQAEYVVENGEFRASVFLPRGAGTGTSSATHSAPQESCPSK